MCGCAAPRFRLHCFHQVFPTLQPSHIQDRVIGAFMGLHSALSIAPNATGMSTGVVLAAVAVLQRERASEPPNSVIKAGPKVIWLERTLPMAFATDACHGVIPRSCGYTTEVAAQSGHASAQPAAAIRSDFYFSTPWKVLDAIRARRLDLAALTCVVWVESDQVESDLSLREAVQKFYGAVYKSFVQSSLPQPLWWICSSTRPKQDLQRVATKILTRGSTTDALTLRPYTVPSFIIPHELLIPKTPPLVQLRYLEADADLQEVVYRFGTKGMLGDKVANTGLVLLGYRGSYLLEPTLELLDDPEFQLAWEPDSFSGRGRRHRALKDFESAQPTVHVAVLDHAHVKTVRPTPLVVLRSSSNFDLEELLRHRFSSSSGDEARLRVLILENRFCEGEADRSLVELFGGGLVPSPASIEEILQFQ